MKCSRFSFFARGAGRAVRSTGVRSLEMVSMPCRPIADFLAEDSCVICGKGREVYSARGNERCESASRTAADQVRALTLPVRVPFLLGSLSNRPLCPACALAFEAAQNPGCLGYAEPARRIVTVENEVFECDRTGMEPPEPEAAGTCFPIPIVAPWMTNDAVLRIVHIMKYKSYTSLSQLVARSIAASVGGFGHNIAPRAVLIPVPRFERNGGRCDHTAAIAAELSAALHLPWESKILIKIRPTPSQSMTPRALRAQNVRGAFAANCVRNCDVILVDDLATTGSTAASCAAALVSAGARSVTLFCFGRAL